MLIILLVTYDKMFLTVIQRLSGTARSLKHGYQTDIKHAHFNSWIRTSTRHADSMCTWANFAST